MWRSVSGEGGEGDELAAGDIGSYCRSDGKPSSSSVRSGVRRPVSWGDNSLGAMSFGAFNPPDQSQFSSLDSLFIRAIAANMSGRGARMFILKDEFE